MHNCAGLYKWIMKIIVGQLGDQNSSANQYRLKADNIARRQLKQNNIFPDLWEDAPQYLDCHKADLLRGMNADDIADENSAWYKRWWKVCGKTVPTGTRVFELRSQVLEWHRYLVANPDAKLVISRGNLPPSSCLVHYYHSHHQPPSLSLTLIPSHTRLQTTTLATDT